MTQCWNPIRDTLTGVQAAVGVLTCWMILAGGQFTTWFSVFCAQDPSFFDPTLPPKFLDIDDGSADGSVLNDVASTEASQFRVHMPLLTGGLVASGIGWLGAALFQLAAKGQRFRSHRTIFFLVGTVLTIISTMLFAVMWHILMIQVPANPETMETTAAHRAAWSGPIVTAVILTAILGTVGILCAAWCFELVCKIMVLNEYTAVCCTSGAGGDGMDSLQSEDYYFKKPNGLGNAWASGAAAARKSVERVWGHGNKKRPSPFFSKNTNRLVRKDTMPLTYGHYLANIQRVAAAPASGPEYFGSTDGGLSTPSTSETDTSREGSIAPGEYSRDDIFDDARGAFMY